jgi:uncharacterized protein involved in copper resistance
MIVDLKNQTKSLVDTTTNETISIKKFTPEEAANMTAFLAPENATTDETLTTDMDNATTDETLTTDMDNATTDETLTTDMDNATTNVNLTDKFNALQGK